MKLELFFAQTRFPLLVGGEGVGEGRTRQERKRMGRIRILKQFALVQK